MISASDRDNAIELIDEAVSSGVALSKACKELGITDRTYFRWCAQVKCSGSTEDQRLIAEHPTPANKISMEERQQILNSCSDEKYASMPPCEIASALADEGVYKNQHSIAYYAKRRCRIIVAEPLKETGINQHPIQQQLPIRSGCGTSHTLGDLSKEPFIIFTS